jgi:hypothetical protein
MNYFLTKSFSFCATENQYITELFLLNAQFGS